MASRWALFALFSSFLLFTTSGVLAQAASSSGVIPPPTSPPAGSPAATSVLTTPPTTSESASPGTKSGTTSSSNSRTTSTTTPSGSSSGSNAPDVLLNVPQLSVGRIELDVDNLKADINLNANVASLVKINAGVAVSIAKVNITIVDVEAQLELIVRLGHLVDIVQRVFNSLDLNPLLITLLNDVTQVVDTVVGVVDGLLGSITQSGTTLNFLVDNLGNIVQSVVGADGQAVDTIVGNYLQNMTYTGVSTPLSGGNVQKQYSYAPLNALVNIIFNSLGQIVQATVAGTGTGGIGGGSSTTALSTSSSATPTTSAS